MPFSPRHLTLIPLATVIAACASNPSAPDRAPVEFRGANPNPRPARVAPAPAYIPSAPVPPPRVVDVGASPSAESAIDEAKGLKPETGLRPGGALLQAKDNPSARRIQVQRDDTLYDISRRYSVNMRALIETNRLEPPYALDPGSVIYLP